MHLETGHGWRCWVLCKPVALRLPLFSVACSWPCYCPLLTGHVLAGLVASWFLGWG